VDPALRVSRHEIHVLCAGRLVVYIATRNTSTLPVRVCEVLIQLTQLSFIDCHSR
jgi:hypothetical protein